MTERFKYSLSRVSIPRVGLLCGLLAIFVLIMVLPLFSLFRQAS